MTNPVPQKFKEFFKIESAQQLAKIVLSNYDFVDCVLTDPLGLWHHCTFHKSQCEAKDLEKGFAFDGSSIRLLTGIGQSDMIMKPSIGSVAWCDPFVEAKTLHVICDIYDSYGNLFERCPRGITKRCIEYMKSTGIADNVMIGPEAEFFVFDSLRYQVSENSMSYAVDTQEGAWNSNVKQEKFPGTQMQKKQYYFPVSPIDSCMNLRSQMLLVMGDVGLPIEKHHHEVASGQMELGFTCRNMLESADMLQSYKYVVKNVARQNHCVATFMPKPLFGDNGSGMHIHSSLWKDGKNLFFDNNDTYHKISQSARYYIGGILKHAPAILAFTNPTTNSYKRLIPGFEAPASLVYSKGNRSAAIRIPLADVDNEKLKRLEFRCPDPAACPYIAISALIMAGLDGIKNKIDPPAPLDCDIYELPKEEKAKIRKTPATLGEALNSLENDFEFLTVGGVFTEDFVQSYIRFKRDEEKSVQIMPHPQEFALYAHC